MAHKKTAPRGKKEKPKGKRVPLNMRTTVEIREKIVAAAEVSGRSQVQEVEHRIEQSFLIDNALNFFFGDGTTVDDAQILRSYLHAIKAATLWSGEDPDNWWLYAKEIPFALNPEGLFKEKVDAFDPSAMAKIIREKVGEFLRDTESSLEKYGTPSLVPEMYKIDQDGNGPAIKEFEREYDLKKSIKILKNLCRREDEQELRGNFPLIFNHFNAFT